MLCSDKIGIRKAGAWLFMLRKSCLKEIVSENHLQLLWYSVLLKYSVRG